MVNEAHCVEIKTVSNLSCPVYLSHTPGVFAWDLIGGVGREVRLPGPLVILRGVGVVRFDFRQVWDQRQRGQDIMSTTSLWVYRLICITPQQDQAQRKNSPIFDVQ